ncbi:MAG: family 3 adenylate cyclase [Gammaproteobacteria bacterium]|jgi:class 3 adenylate cyclase|nr:family 3 adenylate cyclase [Gammaproteobacteria bacterium]NBT45112.1 family 3 adenylate cyclase [Gammaproteobacteria bacterium]NDE35016.1 family 3 adenylate cyclase [Gammaproteobacteria bacterium]NDE55517.1 family 3 adenylate cyclase [Gammaproteobacteria bacterium]NDG87246.1 family 3 adenylate cyclase [Gammaproteobacteria bacterium]
MECNQTIGSEENLKFMKRITYVSRASKPISQTTLDEIAKISIQNNGRVNVTGILLSGGDFFFQILEGEEEAVDCALDRISKDSRHCEIQILKVENPALNRQFPDWSMQTVRLDDMNDALIQAARVMLANLAESRGILARYTQPTIRDFLSKGINPLMAPCQLEDKVVLFGDIAAFDLLSTFYPTEEVAEHASCFLEILSTAVVRNGGQVNKYMGSKVLAYFPVSHVDQAIRSCLEVLNEIKTLRANAAQCRLRNFLYCGFGLTLGPVIEGNFGSSFKLDYTILGNTVNMAARLESMTRLTGRALLLEESVKNACREAWRWEEVGPLQLKGQATSSPYFSLEDEMTHDMRSVDEMLEQVLSTTEEHRRNCPC